MSQSSQRSPSKTKLSRDQIKLCKAVAKLLASIIQWDKRLETKRQNLCANPFFEPFSQFYRIYDRGSFS